MPLFSRVDTCDRSTSGILKSSRRVPNPGGVVDIISAKLLRARAERRRTHEPQQSLRRGAEIVALAQREVEPFPGQRHETERRGLGNRTGGDAAIGASGADRLRDVRPGRTWRVRRAQLFDARAGAVEEELEQKLRAGALGPQCEADVPAQPRIE